MDGPVGCLCKPETATRNFGHVHSTGILDRPKFCVVFKTPKANFGVLKTTIAEVRTPKGGLTLKAFFDLKNP